MAGLNGRLTHYLVAAAAGWWDKLSKEEQKEYISEHPDSKFAGHIDGHGHAEPAAKPGASGKHGSAILEAFKSKKFSAMMKPGSKHRAKSAERIKAGAAKAVAKIAKDPAKLKEAGGLAKEALSGRLKKPSLMYKLGSYLGYGLASSAAAGVGEIAAADAIAMSIPVAGAVSLSPLVPVVGGIAAVALTYAAVLQVKSWRRLFGYGGKYTAYDKQQQVKPVTAAAAADVDAMSDKQALQVLYHKIADFVYSGDITPEDLAKYGKVQSSKDST